MSVTLFDLTPEARINLTKMTFIYEDTRHEKLKLNDPDNMITVINSSLEKANQDYLGYLTRFVQCLSQSELKALAKDGAKIYRGSLVPPASNAPAASASQSVIYRGVRVDAPAATTQAPTKDSDKPSGSSGHKRVYRGVVQDD